MGLKKLFNTLKQEGFVIKRLDQYLLSLNAKDGDRAINVNSPSQASVCNRANYYARNQYETDGAIDPRARRIFDNGTKTHERIQEYLLTEGCLIHDEIPCINEEYNIQGHTDGILTIGKQTEKVCVVPKGCCKAKLKLIAHEEIAVLEIKTINTDSFNKLTDAKEEHKQQAMIYMYCLEERRKYLKEKYKTFEDFYASEKERAEEFRPRYEHLQGGSKFSREAKIDFQVKLCLQTDTILYLTEKPVNKVIFLYENKNNQDLKEYCVERDDTILEGVLKKYETLNDYCDRKEIPPREGTSKSCSTCRFCNFKIQCWC